MSKPPFVIAPAGFKGCPRCREVKPLSAFGGKKQVSVFCRPCKNMYAKEHRDSRKGVILPTDIARFWSRVTKDVPGPLETPCWVWQGAPRNADGYGQFHILGQNLSPHLVALMLVGRVAPPETPIADHKCRNRMCVNPDHLRFVTYRTNAVENNVSPFAKNAQKTHCKRGHLLSGENIVRIPCKAPGGSTTIARYCLTCWPAYRNNPRRIRDEEAA